jgi:two-component system OmpR family response regulator
VTALVFLVEDDPDLRDQLTGLIDHVCDAKVVATADTEAAAVSWIQDHARDDILIVLDLYLKAGTGFGVLESMHDASARNRVIILTNSASGANRARCLALGVRAVYDKTAELEAFLSYCGEHRHEELPR